jgi:prophage DNA circulation protein
MQGWRGQLRPASFRGARFFTDQAGGDYGRRWADHEYPGRETPYAEDLGRAQRVWRFTGYVLGDAYLRDRDHILAACERPGPGELVHPTLGAVQAVCRSVSFTEERERGRICTLTFEFAEAGQLQEPSSATDQNLACEYAADALGALVPAQFAQSFSIAEAGPWVAGAAARDVQNLADGLFQLRLPASGYPQGPLVSGIDYLSGNAARLVASPPLLAESVDNTFAAFTEAGDAAPVTAAMLTFATGWSASAPRGTNGFIASTNIFAANIQAAEPHSAPRLPLPLRRANNAAAIERFARELALREVGYAVTGMTLDNYDEAILMCDKIAAAFVMVEATAANAGEDDIFAALAELRGAITRMIHARAANLNPLVTYRTATTVNSLALAWRLYEDAERDLEIVTRVAARNPAFLPRTGRVLAA